MQRQRGLAGGGLSTVFYESALFAKYCKSRLTLFNQTDSFSVKHFYSPLRPHFNNVFSGSSILFVYSKLHNGMLLHCSRLVIDNIGISNNHAKVCPYQCLLLSINRAESGCEAVGRLGEVSKTQALASLLSCPLLEDLSEWSQWDLIFKPSHGSLREFIERNAGMGLPQRVCVCHL